MKQYYIPNFDIFPLGTPIKTMCPSKL